MGARTKSTTRRAPTTFEYRQSSMSADQGRTLVRVYGEQPQPAPLRVARSDPRWKPKTRLQNDVERANRIYRKEHGRGLAFGDLFDRKTLRISEKSTATDNLVRANTRKDLPVVNGKRVVLIADGGAGMVRVVDPDRSFHTLGAPLDLLTITMPTPDTRGRPMAESEQAALAVLYEAKVPDILLGLRGTPRNYTTGGLALVLPKGTTGTCRFGGEDVELGGTKTEIDGVLYYPDDDTTVGIEAKKLTYVLTEVNARQVGMAAQHLMELPQAAGRVRMLYVQVMSKVFCDGPTGRTYADQITYLIHELAIPHRDIDTLQVKGAWQVDLLLQ